MPDTLQVHAFPSIPSQFTMDKTFKNWREGKGGKEGGWLKGEDSCEKQSIRELICCYCLVKKQFQELSSLEGRKTNSQQQPGEPSLLKNL